MSRMRNKIELARDGIMRGLGMERRGMSGPMLFLTILGVAALGAGMALMYAPSSGRELRSKLGQRMQRMQQRARGKMNSRRHGSGSYADDNGSASTMNS